MRIYKDTTIEEVKSLSKRLETFALKCSPLIIALVKSLKESLNKSDMKTSIKLLKLLADGGRKDGLKEIQSVKVLATGLIPRLKTFAESYKKLSNENKLSEYEARSDFSAKELEKGADNLVKYYETIREIYKTGLNEVKAANTIKEVNQIENEVMNKTQNLSTGVRGDLLVEIYKLTQLSTSQLKEYAQKKHLKLVKTGAYQGFYGFEALPEKFNIIQKMQKDTIAKRFYNAVKAKRKELGDTGLNGRSLF